MLGKEADFIFEPVFRYFPFAIYEFFEEVRVHVVAIGTL